MTHLFQLISYHDPHNLTNQLPWPTYFNQSATMTHLLSTHVEKEIIHDQSSCCPKQRSGECLHE